MGLGAASSSSSKLCFFSRVMSRMMELLYLMLLFLGKDRDI